MDKYGVTKAQARKQHKVLSKRDLNSINKAKNQSSTASNPLCIVPDIEAQVSCPIDVMDIEPQVSCPIVDTGSGSAHLDQGLGVVCGGVGGSTRMQV